MFILCWILNDCHPYSLLHMYVKLVDYHYVGCGLSGATINILACYRLLIKIRPRWKCVNILVCQKKTHVLNWDYTHTPNYTLNIDYSVVQTAEHTMDWRWASHYNVNDHKSNQKKATTTRAATIRIKTTTTTRHPLTTTKGIEFVYRPAKSILITNCPTSTGVHPIELRSTENRLKTQIIIRKKTRPHLVGWNSQKAHGRQIFYAL